MCADWAGGLRRKNPTEVSSAVFFSKVDLWGRGYKTNGTKPGTNEYYRLKTPVKSLTFQPQIGDEFMQNMYLYRDDGRDNERDVRAYGCLHELPLSRIIDSYR